MESWKTLHNFSGYEGSTEGRIRNIRTQRTLVPCMDRDGRMRVSLQGDDGQRTAKVHRVIAETFYGEHPGLDVRHKDGDLTNNHIDNLQWVTRSETISEAYRRGTKKPYQSRRVRVLETDEVYKSIKDCAAATGCSRAHINKYLAGKCSHVKGYHFAYEKDYT